MGAISNNNHITTTREGEVLHLRQWLDDKDYELAPGYYVLHEIIDLGGDTSRVYGIISPIGEDEDGDLIPDGDNVMLPLHLIEHFVGIGIQTKIRG